MEEKPHHSQAFEVYYDMGKSRSLARLADTLDYSPQTVAKWSHEFNWQNRIAERDRQNLALMRRQRLEESEKMRTVYQQAIRKVLSDQFLKPLQEGRLKMDLHDFSDVRSMMKLDMTLEDIDKNDARYDDKTKELTEEEVKVIEMINADGDVWSALTEKLVEQQNKELGDKDG